MPRSKKGGRSRKKKQPETAASTAPVTSEAPTAPVLPGPSDNSREDASVSTAARQEPTISQLARRRLELELLTAQQALTAMLIEEQRTLVTKPSALPPVEEKTDVCAIYTPFATSSAVMALKCCSFLC